jgi:hypothetical protein
VEEKEVEKNLGGNFASLLLYRYRYRYRYRLGIDIEGKISAHFSGPSIFWSVSL